MVHRTKRYYIMQNINVVNFYNFYLKYLSIRLLPNETEERKYCDRDF